MRRIADNKLRASLSFLVVSNLGIVSASFASECDKMTYMGGYVDQDVFLNYTPFTKDLDEDRNYTMGFMVSYCNSHKEGSLFKNFTVNESVLKWFDLKGEESSYTTSFGLNAFTPDTLNTREPVFNDRPYSSLLYMTQSMITSNSAQKSAYEVSLTVGFLGLPIAKWGQTGIHEINRAVTDVFGPPTETPYNPIGWNNQISNGFEPTAMLKLARYDRIGPNIDWLDIVSSFEGRIGYYNGARAGIITKIGLIDQTLPVWRIAQSSGYQSGASAFLKEAKKDELYILASTHLNYMAYNVLLQGQFRDNNHQLNASQVKKVFMENTVGIGWRTNRNNDWLYSCTRRTAEHKLETKRDHYWCSINFTKNL